MNEQESWCAANDIRERYNSVWRSNPSPSALDYMLARVQTWWTILRICIEERLVYRGDFWLGTLMRFLPIVTQIFLWGAVFAGMRATRGTSADQIAGYSYHDFVAYYLLTTISRAFSSMPGLAGGIALQIRNGEIKKYLVQPVDLIGFLLLMRVAHKLVYYGDRVRAVCARVLFVPRLFPGLAAGRRDAGVHRVADSVVSAGLLSGSDDRHDWLLVSGSQLAAVRVHAVQFLFFGPHVSARYAAASRGARSCS